MEKFNLNSKAILFSLIVVGMLFGPVASRAGIEEEVIFPDEEITISMDFQDADLKDVLKVFSIQSGLNTIASEAVQDRKVTLYLDNVPVEAAMNKIFRANNLSYELDPASNIIIVKDWGKPELELITKVFRLKYSRLANSPINYEIETYLEEEEGATTEGTGISAALGVGGGTGAEREGEITGEEGISQTIKKLLSEYGSLTEDVRSNSLIVTDIPSRFPVIDATIAALDVPVAQVMLEVEMLDVTKNVAEYIGLKYGQTPFTFVFQGPSSPTNWPFDTLKYGGLASKAVTSGSVSVNPAGSTYSIALDFLRTHTDTKILARPRILTLSNETAEIKIVTDESIGVITTTTATTGTTVASPERSETGVSLRITPQVNAATGEITMFVVPAVSEATTGNTITSAGQAYQYRDPEVRLTKSIVRVRDGDTIVMGGLIRNKTEIIKTSVPILGDIPILGALFRHRQQSPGRERELLVFITPRIVKDSRSMNLAQAQVGNLNLSLSEREQESLPIIQRSEAITRALREYEH